MKVLVKAVCTFEIDLPIKDFTEICVDNMSITKSDKLINDVFNEQEWAAHLNLKEIRAVNKA
jgi:hypothetical protein